MWAGELITRGEEYFSRKYTALCCPRPLYKLSKGMFAASVENLPPVEVDGFLDRKQELQAGGKRATMR